ncbi:MAG TPA: hypothetical protein V6D26_03345 [Stenomitos sp.]
MEQHPDLKVRPVEQVQEKDIHMHIFGILSQKSLGLIDPDAAVVGTAIALLYTTM